MDAARTLKKTALFLSAALAFAAPSFAQTLLTDGSAGETITVSNTQSRTVHISASDGSSIGFAISKTGFTPGFAVNVLPSGATTPADLLISVQQVAGTCATNPTSCSGSVVLTYNTNQTVTITVNLANGTGSGTGTGSGNQSFQASSTAVTVTAAPNGVGQTTVTLTSNSASPIAFNYGTITPANSWLSVTQSAGSPGQVSSTTPATLTISGNAFGLSNTTLTGSIQLNAANGVQVTINVTFQVGNGSVTTGTLSASPNTVSLSYPSGLLTQAVFVSSLSGTQFFYASPGATWLTINGVSSSTVGPLAVGQYITIGVNQSVAATLGTNTYNTNITLTNTANAADTTTFPVSLSINGSSGTSSGIVAPSALAFAYQSNGTAPYQVILVSGGVSNATFTANSGAWTSASVVTAFTAGTNQVYVSVPTGFTATGSPSVFTGTVNITNTSNLTQAVPVTLTVYPTGSPTLLINAGAQGNYFCTYVAGQQGCGPASYGFSASDSSNVSISAASSVSWATATCSSVTTPSVCTVSVTPSGLPNGLNSGQVTVTGSGTTNGSVIIPVSVLVSGSSGTSSVLTFSPNPVTVTTSTTTTIPVTVTSSTGTNYQFTITQTSPWISAVTSNGSITATTPSTINVTVNPAGFNTGSVNSGSVTVQANNTTQTLPVNLTVGTGTGGTVTVTNSAGTTLNSTTGLTFTSQAGTSAPAAQSITISSASGAAPVSFSYTTSSTWLKVNGINNASTAQGSTTTTLPVTVDPTGLAASPTPYSGTITITPTGGTAVTIPVSYTVTPSASVSATPSTLTFSYIAGSGNAPAAQTINVSGNGGAVGFTATAVSSGNWCQVSPASGTTTATGTVPVTVSVTNLDSLTANQSYTCTITVAGSGGAPGSSTITATLSITAPLPTIVKVTNAASFNTGSISAGEIITVFGTGLGPSTGVSTSPSNGQFPTTAGGVQVLVGGYAAPMIYASATQVSAIVPYEINRPVFLQSVSVQVKYLGQTSNGIALTQVAAAPGIFTANASGSGPGAILNSNLTLNSSGNPAHGGDTIVIYVTGEGQTIPGGVTGKVTSGTAPFTVPVQAPTVTINGVQAVVSFYAEVPTLVAGILQINVVIPQGVGTGNLPVVVSFGSATSQLTSTGVGAVTVAVQ